MLELNVIAPAIKYKPVKGKRIGIHGGYFGGWSKKFYCQNNEDPIKHLTNVYHMRVVIISQYGNTYWCEVKREPWMVSALIEVLNGVRIRFDFDERAYRVHYKYDPTDLEQVIYRLRIECFYKKVDIEATDEFKELNEIHDTFTLFCALANATKKYGQHIRKLANKMYLEVKEDLGFMLPKHSILIGPYVHALY